MKKYINTYLIICLLAVNFSACTDFNEVNTNPNATTKVTSGLLATNLILDVMGEHNNTGVKGKGCLSDDFLSKYLVLSELVDNNSYNKFSRTGFGSLTVLNNISRMVDAAPDDKVRNSYMALGHFLRAKKFFDKTMDLGDIPYSEALQGDDGIYYPKYDTQKDIFLGLLNELDEADRLFSQGTKFEGDIVYNGDPAKWRKAVNVLQLRLLINLYKKADDTDLKIKERFQTVVSRPLFASNAENCQLVYSDKSGQKYPYYKEGNSYMAYIYISSITVDTLKFLSDRRLFYYAKPVASALAGGLSESDWDAYKGSDPVQIFSGIQADATEKRVSTINDRYSELPNCEPIALLSYSEMNFILAEAVVRGLLSGDAKSYYEEGVRAAMNFTAGNTPDNPMFHHNMKITDTYITDYLKGEQVAFATNPARQIRQIIMQKYLATFLQQPFSGYFEYRRTGIPAFPINPASNLNIPSDKMPVRWMYDQSEYDYNGDHVKEAISRQFASDDVNEIMWLLK